LRAKQAVVNKQVDRQNKSHYQAYQDLPRFKKWKHICSKSGKSISFTITRSVKRQLISGHWWLVPVILGLLRKMAVPRQPEAKSS
jgi:hypothetical protein